MRMATDADVLLIGSGAGGLGAALALARAGLRVTICEAHEIPGGYSQSFTLDGLRFSPGIHYLGELGPGEPLRRIYEGLGLGGELEFCELAPRSYVHITLGQRTYPLVKGRAALEAHLAEEFPAEAAGIGGYLDQVQRIGRVLRGDGLQLVTDRAALGALGPWAHRTGQHLIEAHVGDRTLRGLFGAIAGEYGLAPSLAPAPVHALTVCHYLEGAYYPRGGGGGLVKAMVRAFKRAGGQLRLSAPVARILTDEHRVAGVELLDGTRLHARHVVSNADPGVTWRSLLAGHPAAQAARERLSRARWSLSTLSFFLALDRSPAAWGLDSGNHWLFPDEDVDGAFRSIAGASLETLADGPLFLSFPTLKDPSLPRGGRHTLEAFTFAPWPLFNRWHDSTPEARGPEYRGLQAPRARSRPVARRIPAARPARPPHVRERRHAPDERRLRARQPGPHVWAREEPAAGRRCLLPRAPRRRGPRRAVALRRGHAHARHPRRDAERTGRRRGHPRRARRGPAHRRSPCYRAPFRRSLRVAPGAPAGDPEPRACLPEPASRMSNTPPAVDDDPRLASMDDEFRALAAEIVRGFRAMSGARKKRVFHPTSTTVAGSLTVSPMPGAPRNAFFEPGRVLPLIIRFANGVQEDDAAWDNRGATLRVLSPDRPDRLDRGLLDLLLTTGRTFSSRAARDFRAWMLGDRSAREAMVREHPRLGVAAWEMFRAIDWYTDVHYFTKVVQSYVDPEGGCFLTRFRLRDPRRPEDAGFLDAGSALLPPDRTSRAPGDERSRTFLHDDLRRRVGDEGVDLLLELQVRSVPADPAERDDAADASRAWTEDAHPWHEAGRIHLRRVVANPQVESLAFNPANAPGELAMMHARTADDPASLNHLRSIVYEVAAAARLGREPSAALMSLLVPSAGATSRPTTTPPQPARSPEAAPDIPSAQRSRARPLKVAVIGGGVSGLTAARELTAAGAAVTVFERADEVGGKSASVEIGGHIFDLGAHLCSSAYEQLAALLEELGIERDDVSRVILYDIEANAPRTTVADVNVEFLRYHGQVRPHLKGILDPGFERHEARFSSPLAKWAASEGIEKLVAATAIGYTASGYGHPSDPELPALYFLKYAETATFCMDPGTLRYWTPRGGFGNVWKRVADELPDVRCGAEIEAVERDADGVRVRVGGVTHRFDRLVVAAPLHELSNWLELSAEEAELFSKIRLLDYATVIVSAEGLPRDGFFLVKNHCQDPRSVGHAVAFHHRQPDSDVYLFWAYLEEGMTDEALLGRLGEDAARLGGRFTTVHAVHRWQFFPHVSPAAMEAGFYRRAAAMQGRQHTFYAGSLFNFELVDCNMRHARAIARAVMQGGTAAAVEAPRPAPTVASVPATTSSAPARVDELVAFLQRVVREEVGAGGEALGPDDELRRLGLDSLRSIQLLERVSRELDLVLAPILFFEHPTPRALARHLAGEIERQHRSGARRVPVAQGEGAAASSIPRREEDILPYLERVIREGLSLATLPIRPDDELPSLGLDSVTSVQIFDRICHDLKLELAPILFFEHPTLRALAAHLASEVVRQHRLGVDDEPRAGARAGVEHPPSASHAVAPPFEARLARIEDGLARLTAVVQQLAPASPSSAPPPEAAAPADSPAPAGAERALVATTSPWILRAPATERPWHRLIAFHPAGGDARTYARWPAYLPAGVELCAVELPGRSAHRARPMTDHAELMAQLVHELWPLAEELPYSLFGHSFGALLAYEVTRRFERRGRGPTRLFVSSFAAPAHAQTPHLEHLGGLRLSPALWADREVVRSWHHEPDRVQAPIAIFHGQDDTVFRREAVERWAEVTTARTVLHVNAGGHFHILDGALVPGLVGAHLLADRSPGPTAGDEDSVAPQHPESVAEPGVEATAAGEALLRALDRQFGDRCVTSGTWNLYDLAWIARAHAQPERRGGPAFPEALRVLLSHLEPDGSFGALASPLPQNTFLLSLVAANTLLQWNGLEGRDFGPLIEALLEQAERASERMKDRRYLGLDLPYGRLYKFPGLLGQSMIPSNECALLLRQGGRFLAPARQQWLRSHVRDADVAFGEDHFKRGSWLIGFGEYFPAEVVRSPAARDHAESVAPALPAHSAAFAARYFDETRSEKVRASIEAVLAHPESGLRPNGRLQEVYFALHYLAKTGLDLTRLCPGMIGYFQSTQRPYGVAIDDAGLSVDVDSTAIALYLSERLGLDVPIERGERILDSHWDEARECYRNTLGTFPNVNISAMVLRAYLTMRSVPWERKREILAPHHPAAGVAELDGPRTPLAVLRVGGNHLGVLRARAPLPRRPDDGPSRGARGAPAPAGALRRVPQLLSRGAVARGDRLRAARAQGGRSGESRT